MTAAVKQICPVGGCYTITEGGRCAKHKRQQHTGTSKNRPGDPFYSSKRWRKLRAAKLRANPLCECDACKRTGAVVAASVVDHIKPRSERPDLSLCWDNLRSMSESHHNRHTAETRTRV